MDARVSIGGCVLLLAAIGVTAAVRDDGPTLAQQSASDPPVLLRLLKDPVPVGALTLQTIDGRTLSGSQWKGRITLVNFWATWCPPCRAEIPDLIALQARSGNRLQIIGVSEDHGAEDAVRAFVAEHNVNYPIVMATPEIQRAFSGVAGLAVGSVAEALAAFSATAPDVLISDVGLPTDDGYTLIRHIRALEQERGGFVRSSRGG